MFICFTMFYIFLIQSQLRNHEKEHHSLSSDTAALTAVTETAAMLEEAERATEEGETQVYSLDI